MRYYAKFIETGKDAQGGPVGDWWVFDGSQPLFRCATGEKAGKAAEGLEAGDLKDKLAELIEDNNTDAHGFM